MAEQTLTEVPKGAVYMDVIEMERLIWGGIQYG